MGQEIYRRWRFVRPDAELSNGTEIICDEATCDFWRRRFAFLIWISGWGFDQVRNFLIYTQDPEDPTITDDDVIEFRRSVIAGVKCFAPNVVRTRLIMETSHQPFGVT